MTKTPIAVLGIDLGKNSCSLAGMDAAGAVVMRKPNQLGTWLQAMLTRAHPNVVVVALAAKLARIAWAVLRHEKDFDRQALVAA